jgi:hypothetical protein
MLPIVPESGNTPQPAVTLRSLSSASQLLDDAAEAIREAGVVVTIEPRSSHELHVDGTGLELVVHLAEHFGDDVISAIVGGIIERASRSRKKPPGQSRQIAIEGPSGEILAVIDIDADASEPPSRS